MSESKLLQQSEYPFLFQPSACQQCDARCCRGPKGYIWLTKERAMEIAQLLNMHFDRFASHYLRVVSGALSLREVYVAPHEYACIALDQNTNECTIYESRPEQCRTFPFWPENKSEPERPARYCMGITLDTK